MVFGERLKSLREEKGINQVEFSKIINKSRSSVAGYEVVNRAPDSKTLLLIADYFDCTLDYLFGRSEYKNYIEEKLSISNEQTNNIPSGNLEMMVLKHDPKYNRWKDISVKIKEESIELQIELQHGNYGGIVDESLDLITVAMNAINKCDELGIDIESAIRKHQEKLLSRDWKAERVIKFSIEEL